VSAPVGPTGVASCNKGASGKDSGRPSPPAPVFHGAVAYGHFWSDLIFNGNLDATIERGAVVTSHDFFLTDDLTFSLGAGAALFGSLGLPGFSVDLGPGWVGSLSVAYNFLDGSGSLPFLIVNGTFAASAVATKAPPPHISGRLTALDFRGGLTVGKTFFDRLSPYLAIRAFGGPVIWTIDGEELTGTDKHHYQPAAGLVVSLPGGVDLFGEGAPFGERGVTAGLGYTY